jgi:DNA phosphorothioation-associated putative methyltransferase
MPIRLSANPVREMATSPVTIARHRTAIRRYAVSRPIARALADGLITKDTAVFDYGCGRGADVEFLCSRRITAGGWDPYYRPHVGLAHADVVNLGYVLNVIEDPSERSDALRQACDLAGRLLIVAVRTDQPMEEAEEFGDGFCTGRGTFQKLYTPHEFRDYLNATLARVPLLIAPGIAYIFKDEELKSWYLANRAFTRRLEYRIDLIEAFARDRLARRHMALTARLGRLPLSSEFPSYARLLERFGPPRRLERLVLRAINRTAYEGSRVERRTDILTYLAMLHLEGLHPPPVQSLPASIQADVRALWRNYRAAVVEAERLLFSIGNPESVRAAAVEAHVGKLLPEDLYIHRSGADELLPLLRLIVFAATRIVGEVPYEVVKISLHGRSVSFLQYAAFDDEAHPSLSRSVRVYLPRATYRVREYDPNDNPPILHRKDALVLADYPRYHLFRQLTAQEEALGLLGAPDIGYRVGWEAFLAQRGLAIKGHEVVPA